MPEGGVIPPFWVRPQYARLPVAQIHTNFGCGHNTAGDTQPNHSLFGCGPHTAGDTSPKSTYRSLQSAALLRPPLPDCSFSYSESPLSAKFHIWTTLPPELPTATPTAVEKVPRLHHTPHDFQNLMKCLFSHESWYIPARMPVHPLNLFIFSQVH